MKDLVRYVLDHPAAAVLGLAAIVLVGIGVWLLLAKLGLTGGPASTGLGLNFQPLGFSGQQHGEYGIPTLTATPNSKLADVPVLATPPVEDFLTQHAEKLTPEVHILGQYCQNLHSYTNFEIIYGSPAGSGWNSGLTPRLGITVDDVAFPVTCVLVKSDSHSALFNCTGPSDSSATIHVEAGQYSVEDVPIDIPFMACEKSENEPGGERCTGRDCR